MSRKKRRKTRISREPEKKADNPCRLSGPGRSSISNIEQGISNSEGKKEHFRCGSASFDTHNSLFRCSKLKTNKENKNAGKDQRFLVPDLLLSLLLCLRRFRRIALTLSEC